MIQNLLTHGVHKFRIHFHQTVVEIVSKHQSSTTFWGHIFVHEKYVYRGAYTCGKKGSGTQLTLNRAIPSPFPLYYRQQKFHQLLIFELEKETCEFPLEYRRQCQGRKFFSLEIQMRHNPSPNAFSSQVQRSCHMLQLNHNKR